MQTSTRQTSTRQVRATAPRITELPAIAVQVAEAKVKLIADEAKRVADAEMEKHDAVIRQKMALVAAGLIRRKRR